MPLRLVLFLPLIEAWWTSQNYRDTPYPTGLFSYICMNGWFRSWCEVRRPKVELDGVQRDTLLITVTEMNRKVEEVQSLGDSDYINAGGIFDSWLSNI